MIRKYLIAAAVAAGVLIAGSVVSAALVSAEVAGHETVSNGPSQSYTAGQRYFTAVNCPTGKVVLGGGFEAPSDLASYPAGPVVASRPGGDPATQWRVEFIPTSSYTGPGYAAYAVCATP